jgi:sugar transferase EpsL
VYQRLFKRALDVAIAFLALLVCSPLLLIIAVAVWMNLGRPVLFRQLRPGLDGRPFTILKFRTMVSTRGTEADIDRLTPFGQTLRALSLDELPELLNVLRGDMSLVGPRPLLMQYLDRYTPEQARRHELRPGITGWAQIHGRNTLSWEDKFQFDVWYVDHCSFWLDLRILASTVWKTVRREGISEPGQVTAREFMGSTQS